MWSKVCSVCSSLGSSVGHICCKMGPISTFVAKETGDVLHNVFLNICIFFDWPGTYLLDITSLKLFAKTRTSIISSWTGSTSMWGPAQEGWCVPNVLLSRQNSPNKKPHTKTFPVANNEMFRNTTDKLVKFWRKRWWIRNFLPQFPIIQCVTQYLEIKRWRVRNYLPAGFPGGDWLILTTGASRALSQPAPPQKDASE